LKLRYRNFKKFVLVFADLGGKIIGRRMRRAAGEESPPNAEVTSEESRFE
jgi:hypothetical protein